MRDRKRSLAFGTFGALGRIREESERRLLSSPQPIA